MLEEKIKILISEINETFKGVTLWREANVLDDYGTLEERKLEREKDELHDWTKIPFSLIEDLRYQSVLSFFDVKGLKFHLPICMIYSLSKYRTSQSLIPDTILYKLIRKETVKELKEILDQKQIECVKTFLRLCLEIGDDYFDLNRVEKNLERYW